MEERVRNRLRALRSRWAVPAWLLFFVAIVEKVADVQFLFELWGKAWPRVVVMTGWAQGALLALAGLAWLAALVLRAEKKPHALPPSPLVDPLPEPYVSFEPGVVLYQRLLQDAPTVHLEPFVWFVVFQRSRIANEADAARYVTMSFEFQTPLTETPIKVPSNNVWFRRAGQFYSTDLRLAGREQATVFIAAALTHGDQRALFGGILGAKKPPDVANIRLDVVCTVRDMANRCERVFKWSV